jgi:hypothetical protein
LTAWSKLFLAEDFHRHFNPFTAVDELIRFNSPCFKLPATTLFDLIFQRRSFILNQLLTCNYRWETYTAAARTLSLSLLYFIMIILRKMNPCLSLGPEEEWVLSVAAVYKESFLREVVYV